MKDGILKSQQHYNRGIAIGPILFVIAILAVLVGAISSGSGTGNDVSPERARILAAQIINQAQQVKNAVDRVRANGCDVSEISFQNSFNINYVNPNAPLADKPWCHVFQPQGGGLAQALMTVRSEMLDSSQSAYIDYGYIGVYYQSYWPNAGIDSGSSGIDLVLFIPYLSDAVCLALNQTMGISITPTSTANATDIASLAYFKGSFYTSGYALPATSPPTHLRCINQNFNRVADINQSQMLLVVR